MNYYEYVFITTDTDIADILIALLSEKGFNTFEQFENQLSAYINAEHIPPDIDVYLNTINKQFEFTWQSNKCENINWNAEWEKNFQPVIIDNKCVIRASFHLPFNDMQYDVLIEPRMSFGTGHHATTYLMASEMMLAEMEGKIVADAGCGTGILSILAGMCGASTVFALDNDEWAYKNASENIQLNKMEKIIELVKADLNILKGKKFDLLLANINRNIIQESLSLFSECLHIQGHLFISGFLENDTNSIAHNALHNDLHLIKTSSREGWSCAVLMHTFA